LALYGRQRGPRSGILLLYVRDEQPVRPVCALACILKHNFQKARGLRGGSNRILYPKKFDSVPRKKVTLSSRERAIVAKANHCELTPTAAQPQSRLFHSTPKTWVSQAIAGNEFLHSIAKCSKLKEPKRQSKFPGPQ
jgi:hypothetical protein